MADSIAVLHTAARDRAVEFLGTNGAVLWRVKLLDDNTLSVLVPAGTLTLEMQTVTASRLQLRRTK